VEINASDLSRKEAYYLLTSLVVPRPIAWVSTVSKEGIRNLAPFSYFMGVGSDPPTVAISVSHKDEGLKDTGKNILESREFCINLVEENHLGAMDYTATLFPPEVDEFDEALLKGIPTEAIRGFRVQGARAALECRLLDEHIYGRQRKTHLFVAEVVHAFIDESLRMEGRPMADQEAIRPVARLAGKYYAPLADAVKVIRKKPEGA
jgi:flavin reductase (DIM6/NTAB) family NADH-FMN oxidoreductase RutF